MVSCWAVYSSVSYSVLSVRPMRSMWDCTFSQWRLPLPSLLPTTFNEHFHWPGLSSEDMESLEIPPEVEIIELYHRARPHTHRIPWRFRLRWCAFELLRVYVSTRVEWRICELLRAYGHTVHTNIIRSTRTPATVTCGFAV